MISSVGSMSMGAMQGQRPAGPPPKPEEKFQELDTDGSGSLNVDELAEMAAHMSEMTGQEVSAEDLMAELDSDGNGTLEVGEMPEPPKGPPPFLAADGSVQDSPAGMESFNPLESLLSYLDSSAEDETTSSLLDVQG